MTNKRRFIKTAMAGIIAISAGLSATSVLAVPDSPKFWEKCAGIAKAGKNDCGALDGKHACAGKSSKNNDAQEWVYVPQGTCAKITGGRVAKVKPAK